MHAKEHIGETIGGTIALLNVWLIPYEHTLIQLCSTIVLTFVGGIAGKAGAFYFDKWTKKNKQDGSN